jgi:hypothetical protein
MSDLKTFWPNPGGPPDDPGLAGSSVVSSGSDPSITVDSPNGLAGQVLWPNPSVPDPSGAETENSVSGLPSLPNRFEPSDQPPGPPSLQDRRPGTIDER